MWHLPSRWRHRRDVRYQVCSPQLGLFLTSCPITTPCPGQDVAALLAQPQNTARLSPPGPQMMEKPLEFRPW